MLRKISAAAAALALAGACTTANARASVVGTFAGTEINQAASGWGYFDPDPIGEALAPGQSKTWSFSYSITLYTDGLPAERNWECAPIPYGLDCGPAATGKETAQFDFGLFLPREASGDWTYTVSGYPVSFTLSDPGTATYSGTFTVTETAAEFIFDPFTWSDRIQPWGIAFADVAPVPEAPVSTMLLAGLAGLALARRRR